MPDQPAVSKLAADAERWPHRYRRARRFQLNRLLPPSIRVTHLQRVPPDFHCRYSALSKVGSWPYQGAHALQPSPSHPAAFTPYATSPLRA